MELRPYQSDCIAAINRHLAERDDNPLAVLPTAAGKTIIFATLLRQWLTAWPDTRVIVLAHIKELISQAADKLRKVWPAAPVGIWSAGIGKKEGHRNITVAGIQSIYKRAFEFDPWEIVIVDEAHLIPVGGEGMYRRFLDDCRKMNPLTRVIGFTATPFRLDGGHIARPEYVLNHVAYEANIGDLIGQGYLCKLRSKATAEKIDTAGVKSSKGDFIAAELEQRANTDGAVSSAVKEIVEKGVDRQAWLIFCCGVKHAYHVSVELEKLGVVAPVVTGDTPDDERDRIIADFDAGRVRAVVNVNCLTTGLDVTRIDLIALLRPTQSTSLYIQMVGRGFRLHPSKADCVAEGQRVLTDKGLVPIENVTTEMKVWDGIDFVEHCGTVFRGEQEVITYAGLTATPDHKVWTEEGWKALGECAVEQTPIFITEVEGTPVRENYGRLRRDRSGRREEASLPSDSVYRLWKTVSKGLHELSHSQDGRMPGVREPSAGTEVAGDAGDRSEAAVYESERSGMGEVRRSWDKFPVQKPDGDGGLGSRESRSTSCEGDRQDRQQRPLRAGESSLLHSVAESIEHAEASDQQVVSYIPARPSGDQVRRLHATWNAKPEPDAGRDHRAIPSKVEQTKRRVWDILNAGPRHRFTAEGLLVSNCLILDFGGNVRRHGPVDCVRVNTPDSREKGAKGEAPTKVCPQCNEILHLAARECTACGFLFPEPEIKHERKADVVPILAGDAEPWDVEVVEVQVEKHPGKNGKPPTLRVSYFDSMHDRYSEFVCLEHDGFAGSKGRRWWERRFGRPVPATVDEALARNLFLASEIKAATESITVKQAGKYREVVDAKVTNRKLRAEAF